MISKKNIFFSILIISLALTTSGCIKFSGGETVNNDSGIFKTTNKGDSWGQRVLIPTTSGKPKSLGAINATALSMDPSDNKALYWGSDENGLIYTYDAAASWQPVSTLGQIAINAVAVDYKSKCVIYASSGNKLIKSTDCSRTWSQIYYDNDLKVKINSIALDFNDEKNIYFGNSRGDVIKSYDSGGSWQTLARFKNDVQKIVLSPQDSQVVFAATASKGIQRSTDGGNTWVDLSENLKDYSGAKNFKDLIASPIKPNLIFLASAYGLLKSEDNGDNWTSLTLITEGKTSAINSLAISPKNENEIYYVTSTTFNRSLDGGQNWTTKKLPTTGSGWKLLIDPEDTSIIYMGVKKINKK